VYNSCDDRHCPSCGTARKQQWLEDRRKELLPVEYFHCVFTTPHTLNPLIDVNRRLLLGELFGVVNWVLQHFAADPQWRLEGDLGFIALLHTWNQKLLEHFHLHCIVPGGVWRAGAGQWVSCRRRYLFGKKALAAAFRNRMLKRLRRLRANGKLRFHGPVAHLAEETAWKKLLEDLAVAKWVVWPKPTAAGPEHALDYLSRYTHRVAISDHRILAITHSAVRFSWRDRADHNVLKTAELPIEDFCARFLRHILPPGFHKVRFYGWLSPSRKKTVLPAISAALGAAAQSPEPAIRESPAERILRQTGVDVRRCPVCGQSSLSCLGIIAPQPSTGPPR